MKARTKIPILEALLEQNQKTRWTPEIDRVLLDYYVQFAHDSDVNGLAGYINEKYDRNFTNNSLSKRYSVIKEQR